jgi:hypothetical protein
MSDFTDQLELDLQAIFLNNVEFGATVKYAGRDVQALIEYGSGDEYKGFDDFDIKAIIRIRIKDVPAVNTGDEILIDINTWEVIGARLSKCGLLWEININRRTS